MKHFITTIILLFIIQIIFAQSYNYKTNGNVSFSSANNWLVFQNNRWETSTHAPNYNANEIIIATGDTALIADRDSLDDIIIDSGAVLINTFQQGTGLNNSFVLLSGDGVGITIKNGGKYIHDMLQHSALPAGDGTFRVEKGGMIKINNNVSGGCADMYANDENEFYNRVTWCDSSIFYWNTSGIISTAGITYFPNVHTDSVPIFIYNGTAIYLGGTDNTTINAMLIIPPNAVMNFRNRGDKIFRNGIINYGTLNQLESCGKIIIGSSKSIIKNLGTINFNNSGTQIGQSGTTSCIQLESNIDFNGSNVNISPNTTIIFNNNNLQNIDNLDISENTHFTISHPYGYDSSIVLTNTITNDSLLNIQFTGSEDILTGESLPFQLQSLTINMSGSVIIPHNISLQALSLNHGKIIMNNNTLALSTSEPDAISEFSDSSYIIGKLKRAVSDGNEYIFPIGSVDHLQKANIYINNSVNLNEITFEFKDSTVSTNVVEDFTIDNHSIASFIDCGFWRITPNHIYESVDYNLELYVNKHSFDYENCDINNMHIIKRESASELWGTSSQGTVIPSETEDEFIVITSNNINGFSDGAAVTVSAEALALNNCELSVTASSCRNIVNWKNTKNDIISLELQKSSNCSDYSTIYSTCEFLNQYSYTDDIKSVGTKYYRLKLTNSLGQPEFSNIVSCTNAWAKHVVSFSKNTLYFNTEHWDIQIIITNSIGQIVHTAKPNTRTYALSFLPQGLYTCIISFSGTIADTESIYIQ